MKLLCKTMDLLHALTLVSRAISNQQALPILGNILLEAKGKRCVVSATDLELSIITSFDVDIENEGSITVPARAFLNFAQYNTDPEVLLETTEGTQLKCSSPHAKTIIAGEAASEYPTISTMEKETGFSMEVSPLLEALQLVIFASAKTTLRPVLAGVYIRSEKNHLILVATDSYRLSEYTLPSKGGSVDISCIIPSKVLEELRGILSSSKAEKHTRGDDTATPKNLSEVQISLSSQQIEIRVGHTHLLSRLIEGKFPDYRQIIPGDTKTKITVSTKDLINIAKRMHYFAREINNNLTWTVRKSNNTLHITTPHTQAGRDEATLDVELTGHDNKIALSSSYLLDFLGHVNDDVIEVHLTDSMHPAVFRLPSDNNLLHLIMPLRIQEE